MARPAAVVFAVVFAAALAACRDDGVAALESTRDRVCKCEDATCVNAAMEALEDKPTRHQRKAEGIAREITDCIARIYRETDARDVGDDEPDEPIEAPAPPPAPTAP